VKRKVYAAVEDTKTTRGELTPKKQGRVQDAGVISVVNFLNEEKCGLGNGHSEEEK